MLRHRARVAGKSLQRYMRDEIERLARQPTDEELFEQIEQFAAQGGVAVDVDALLADLDADRR